MAVGKNGALLHLLRISNFFARSSISPVPSLGLVVPSGRWATLPVTRTTSSVRSLRDSSSTRLAGLGGEDHLRLAVAVAEVDEQRAAVVAIRIDPAAQRDLLADVFGPQLTAGMGAKQGASPDVKCLAAGACVALPRLDCKWKRPLYSRPRRSGKVRLLRARSPPARFSREAVPLFQRRCAAGRSSSSACRFCCHRCCGETR